VHNYTRRMGIMTPIIAVTGNVLAEDEKVR
jgi:hypothetical protein